MSRGVEEPCPACGQQIISDSLPHDERARPKPGDYGICIYCAVLFTYNADLSRRVMTTAEIVAMPDENRIQIERYRHFIDSMARVLGTKQ